MKKKTLLSTVNFFLLDVPFPALVKGTEENNSETFIDYWSIGFFVSLPVFLGLFLQTQFKIKKISLGGKEYIEEYEYLLKRKVFYKWAYSLIAMLAAFFLIKMIFNS